MASSPAAFTAENDGVTGPTDAHHPAGSAFFRARMSPKTPLHRIAMLAARYEERSQTATPKRAAKRQPILISRAISAPMR